MTDHPTELKVAEARQRDVGRSLVRLGKGTMDRLGIRAGDFVKLEGNKMTVAVAWPAYEEDEALDIVRIDGIIRHNAGVSIGETVKVSDAQIHPASKVAFAPTELIRFSHDFNDYVQQMLEDKPLTKGDTVMIPVLGEALRLVVVSIQTSPSSYMTAGTSVIVKEEPLKEDEAP